MDSLIDTDSLITTKTMFASDGRLKKGAAKYLRLIGKKWCNRCKRILSSDSFGINSSENDGKTRYCKECTKRVGRATSSKRSSYIKTNREDRKTELVNILGGKCMRCGYDEFMAGLDFHHVAHHSKRFNIAKMLSETTTKTADRTELMKELDKCALLCSNCHKSINEWQHGVEWRKVRIGWELIPVS